MPLKTLIYIKLILSATATIAAFYALFALVQNIILLAYAFILVMLSLVVLIDGVADYVLCERMAETDVESFKNKNIVNKKVIVTS